MKTKKIILYVRRSRRQIAKAKSGKCKDIKKKGKADEVRLARTFFFVFISFLVKKAMTHNDKQMQMVFLFVKIRLYNWNLLIIMYLKLYKKYIILKLLDKFLRYNFFFEK
jgi:hypothetical protein